VSARPDPPRAIGFWADIVPRAVESGFASDLAPLLNAFAFARAPPVLTGRRTDWDHDVGHRATRLAVAAGSQAKLRASWVWRHYRAAVFCAIEAAEWGQPAQAEHERKATWFEAHGMPPLCCDRCGRPEPKRACAECDKVHCANCNCNCNWCPRKRGGCGGDRDYCGCVTGADGRLSRPVCSLARGGCGSDSDYCGCVTGADGRLGRPVCSLARGGCGGDSGYCSCVGGANGQLMQRRW